MILKDSDYRASSNPMIDAGRRQEQDVAFYLRRAFKDHPHVCVFHDLKLTFRDEHAQIDHLILYPYGFILVESKSITGEVTVNSVGEWSRSYKGVWKGMPSPIKQVSMQSDILKSLLQENAKHILGTLLLMQKRFSGRCWDSFCAISSNAIINREQIPQDIGSALVKSEFIADVITEKMNLPDSVFQRLNTLTADSRPTFSAEEMTAICQFLLRQGDAKLDQDGPSDSVIMDFDSNSNSNSNSSKVKDSQEHLSEHHLPALVCKGCGESEKLVGSWGKYGYFVRCGVCQKTTAMKSDCPICQSGHTKVNKNKFQYFLTCNKCSFTGLVFENPH